MARINPNIKAEINRLYKDLKIEPFQDKFDCDYYKQCKNSLRMSLRENICTGNWPYIGVDYGKAEIAGLRCRILVIAMDQGGVGEAQNISFENRQVCWFDAFNKRVNAHTGGTSLIIQRLVDNNSHDQTEITLQAFAHTNSVKCSPKKEKEQMKSETTKIMQECCRNHLAKEIEILKPDLIITEGKGPITMVRDIFELSSTNIEPYKDGKSSNYCEVYIGEPVILAVPHPARKPGLKWREGELPSYFKKAIDRVRDTISR